MSIKFPQPIITIELEEDRKRKEQEKEWGEQIKREVLKSSTKKLIEILREMRYRGHHPHGDCYTEKDIQIELSKRPHQRNRMERKAFVKKQQKRTERKTRGAR